MRPLVLNTRSQSQANQFSVLLHEAGFDVLEIPALDIHKLDFRNLLVQTLSELESQDIVVFTSVNAVLNVLEHPQAVEMLQVFRIAAVGAKTASILVKAGITVHLQSVQSSSTDLAEIIAKYAPKRVLYLSGTPNTGVLKDRLSKNSVFIEIPVYTSSPRASLQSDLDNRQSELEKTQYLVFLSVETLSAFHDALGRLQDLLVVKHCVVISTRVAEFARTLGYQNISIAQTRSLEAIVSELVSLSSGPG